MVHLVGVIDIIPMSILMKNSCSASRNLMKSNKLNQFLKNGTKLRLQKLEDQLDIFGWTNGPKSNSTKKLVPLKLAEDPPLIIWIA